MRARGNIQGRLAVSETGIYFAMMLGAACLWYRSRLERYVDSALGDRSMRLVAGHIASCAGCASSVAKLRQLGDLVRSASAAPGLDEPDWSGFWPAVRERITREPVRPFSDPWWLPWWKPVWGHPRLATSTALAASLIAVAVFWPGSREVPPAYASPVVVQDVSADPRGTVMVYSNRDDVTVIWVFASDTSGQ